MKEVFVFGSINADLVTSVSRMPTAGETIKGNDFIVNQGGKGANQAAACKKLGCERVRFIGAVGDDMFGEVILNSLKTYGVDCEAVAVKNGEQSGVCTILLDESRKDNFLILSSGANDTVTGGEVKEYLRLFARVGDIFITQLEMNLTAVGESLAAAKEIGMYTILNPAPAMKMSGEMLSRVDLLVLNETECESLSGINPENEADAQRAYEYFSSFGVKEAVITLGERGSYYINVNDGVIYCPSKKVKVVDTTSAGDTFIGALAMKKAQGFEIAESLEFATRCSAITVSKKGAAVSIPTCEEIVVAIK